MASSEGDKHAIYGLPCPRSLTSAWLKSTFAGSDIITPDMEIADIKLKKSFYGGNSFLVITLKNTEDVNKIILNKHQLWDMGWNEVDIKKFYSR